MFISVDLPVPEGPMIARYSLRWILMVTPAQGVDGLFAHLVQLGDVLDLDDEGAGGADRPLEMRGRRGRRDHGGNGAGGLSSCRPFSASR